MKFVSKNRFVAGVTGDELGQDGFLENGWSRCMVVVLTTLTDDPSLMVLNMPDLIWTLKKCTSTESSKPSFCNFCKIHIRLFPSVTHQVSSGKASLSWANELEENNHWVFTNWTIWIGLDSKGARTSETATPDRILFFMSWYTVSWKSKCTQKNVHIHRANTTWSFVRITKRIWKMEI